MPANLPPQYFEAEKVYRQATTPEDKIEGLEAMLAIMPKHKGTDKLRAELRRRIAKFTEEAQKRPSVARRGSDYSIRSEGAGQVALIGLPNVGKSQLVSTLTDAFPDVADYPYATKIPLPGMMKFEDIQIQLLDMPPITDRDAKPWFSHLLRTADAILVIIDLSDDSLIQMEAVLEELGKLKIEIMAAKVDAELQVGIVSKDALVIGNKADADISGRQYMALKSRYANEFVVISVSARDGAGLEEMKLALYEKLNIIRVYTKSPGKEPDFQAPVILRRGSTVEDMAGSVHKDFRNRLKYAQIWGSGKFDGQRVKRGHILEDKDVVEYHM